MLRGPRGVCQPLSILSMPSFFSTLLLLGATALPAQAAIAAWFTEIGPQVILQNETTSLIRYSSCNSYDIPKYSYTDGSVFSLTHKPKAGSPLAGAGWWTQLTTIASIFYIAEEGGIANALFECNMSTGLFQSQGNWIVSGQAPSINKDTGLAIVLLGEDSGYRVYYHDREGAINELGYTPRDNWQYRGVISQDINSLPALAAAFSSNDNITVASPRDDQNIAVTRWHRDDSWHRSTLPHILQGDLTTNETARNDIAINETATANFSLPAWDGKLTSLGISVDGQSTRFLWYIGNDSSLYSVADENSYWTQQANQSIAFWPLADKPNADLAVAHHSGSSDVRIYYMVKGQLSEIKYQDKLWKAWSTVAPPPPPAATQSGAAPSSTESASADTGLSPGAKAGIGVGVSLGAIALGTIIAAIVFMRRRKQLALQQRPEAENGSASNHSSYGSPTSMSGGYAWEKHTYAASNNQAVHQLDETTSPSELAVPRPVFELPVQPYSHELGAGPSWGGCRKEGNL